MAGRPMDQAQASPGGAGPHTPLRAAQRAQDAAVHLQGNHYQVYPGSRGRAQLLRALSRPSPSRAGVSINSIVNSIVDTPEPSLIDFALVERPTSIPPAFRLLGRGV